MCVCVCNINVCIINVYTNIELFFFQLGYNVFKIFLIYIYILVNIHSSASN